MSQYKEINLSKLKRYAVSSRISKIEMGSFAKRGKVDTSEFLNCLPDVLKARDLRQLISDCMYAKRNHKPILVGLGGHVIKCGLAPLLIEMMEEGLVSAFLVNGSVCIHDFEIAMNGQTSEDVAVALVDGSFGMAIETADTINGIISDGAAAGLGFGEAISEYLWHSAPNAELSLLANAAKHSIPVCVHVAIGTDIIHQHASADGAAIGDCSLRDFRILADIVTQMNGGGVLLNFGSAVILPEVFLKALTVARNIVGEVKGFSTAVFDMNYHYRAAENIVRRPTMDSGKGYYFIGHHEIMIPLFIKSLLSSI